MHAYRRLPVMILLSFVSLYVLMYAMVDRLHNVYPSLNQAYMAGLMTAAIMIIEILLMAEVYPRRHINSGILTVSALAGAACFLLIRAQATIDDKEFLRSMIPHHASAILMCEEASLDDPDIRLLCKRIVVRQQAEIREMKVRLAQ